jgi:hypothetical protein
MQPENYVEAPNVATLVLTPPSNPAFWKEVGSTLEWAKYVWVGPTPNVTVDLTNVYAGRRFSSQAIYEGIIESVGALKIPGVSVGPQIIHEGGPFSPYRAYLRVRREFSEFLVCAAPVGNSFFVTVRKIDRFRHVKWFHYLIVLGALGMLGFSLIVAFGWDVAWVGIVLFVSLVWSFMRYASQFALSWLAENLPGIPVIGALYLRWFRPDTFFRQDLHASFLTLVDGAIRNVIAGIDPTQPIRPATESHGGPILKDLGQPG